MEDRKLQLGSNQTQLKMKKTIKVLYGFTSFGFIKVKIVSYLLNLVSRGLYWLFVPQWFTQSSHIYWGTYCIRTVSQFWVELCGYCSMWSVLCPLENSFWVQLVKWSTFLLYHGVPFYFTIESRFSPTKLIFHLKSHFSPTKLLFHHYLGIMGRENANVVFHIKPHFYTVLHCLPLNIHK